MGHVCLHICKIYVNMMLNQNGNVSAKSVKCQEGSMFHI